MVYVRLNNKDFELPLAELYINDIKNYVHGGVLDFSGFDIETKYNVVDYLFGYLSRTFIMTLGDIQDTFPEHKYAPAIGKLRSRMDPVDRMQKYCRENGNTEKSVEIMCKFMEEMLTLWDAVKEEENNMENEQTVVGSR